MNTHAHNTCTHVFPGGNLFDQLPTVRLCVRFYPFHDMASLVQSATRQHNIYPVLGIIEENSMRNNYQVMKISLKRVCGRKQR